MFRKIIFLILLSILQIQGELKLPDYKNSKLPIEVRIQDLIHRMTLEEKAKQLDMYRGVEVVDNGLFSVKKAEESIGITGIGSIHDFYPVSASISNKIQEYAVNQTRLGIPVLFIEEALHGYSGQGATCFPAPIGLGATWNRELMKNIGKTIAAETRAHGIHMVLSPVLGLARELRWGRVEETYGEDPYLASELGLAIIKGMQGDDLTSDSSVVSEPKHFGVHSVPESGSNTGPVSVGMRDGRELFLSVFEKAVRQGGAMGMMAAYHEWDGIPCVSNHWLLTDLLRDEWGFQGLVLSDLGAIAMQYNNHFTVSSPKEAIVNSIKAGMDMQFYDFEHDIYQNSIIEAVKEGFLFVEELDQAVSNVLRVKFSLGLFENPYTDTSLVSRRLGNQKNRDLALKSGRESICLLKNENHLLPLNKKIKTIALLGPLADESALGGYSPHGAAGKTILQALRDKYPDSIEILYEKGTAPNTILSVIHSDYLKPSQGQGQGLWAEYFDNPELEGTPFCSKVESNLALYWGTDSPCTGVGKDNFSVRLTGIITPPVSGKYRIGFISDDKGRLYLNKELLVDNWGSDFRINTMLTKEVYMKAGQSYPIRMDFCDIMDYAGIQLKWKLINGDLKDKNSPLNRAIGMAEKADVSIVVLGESSEVVGEGKDKTNLELEFSQKELINGILSTGKPIVVILLNGRPLIMNQIAEEVPALLECWFPGQSGGDAVVDVLFGEYNPSGKLPVSIPRSVGQLPIFYNRKPSAKRNWVDMSYSPLYPFGHGLSYTSFEYSNLQISPQKTISDNEITISLDLKNTGSMYGTEVVQLYINDEISSVTTPIKSLKEFQKISLDIGEKKTVKFKLTKDHLSLWNREMKRVVEPGLFKVMIGSSSEDIRLEGAFEMIKNNEYN